MNHTTTKNHKVVHECTVIPDFERLKFYYGQLLGVADFQTEQRYFLEKLRLHNRCFHGVGIVCGLEVEPVPAPEDCGSEDDRYRKELEDALARVDSQIDEITQIYEKSPDQRQKTDQRVNALRAEREELQRRLDQLPDCNTHESHASAELCVSCGWAIDCDGREIIVRQNQRLDLWKLLSAEQMHEVKQHSATDENGLWVELSICYCEQPTYPTRPIVTDTCAPVSKCVYGRVREGFRFRLSLTPSEPDRRCSNCCDACEYDCVVLARIHWHPWQPIESEDVDLRPRRVVSVYQPTVITGISWLHGATYTPEQAARVLGTKGVSDGIEVEFSRPVFAETLQQGVVDLWRIHGGKGMSGVFSHIQGGFVDKPDSGLIQSFKYRDESREALNENDQVLITIRGNFILDECCQPIDGEHIGGRVPQLEGYPGADELEEELPPVPDCVAARRQPWTSGNGRPGATFESWFFIYHTGEKAS